MKYTALETVDYTVYFERIRTGELFTHIDYFSKWTKTSKQKFLNEVLAFYSLIDEPIFAVPYLQNNKMKKFLKMLKFEKLTDIQADDEHTLAVYIWRG